MAKKEPPKPIFPLKHEFYASLDNFIHKAGMLRDVVGIILQNGGVEPKIAGELQKHLDAFDAASGG
jgi:hypothetical protein